MLLFAWKQCLPQNPKATQQCHVTARIRLNGLVKPILYNGKPFLPACTATDQQRCRFCCGAQSSPSMVAAAARAATCT